MVAWVLLTAVSHADSVNQGQNAELRLLKTSNLTRQEKCRSGAQKSTANEKINIIKSNEKQPVAWRRSSEVGCLSSTWGKRGNGEKEKKYPTCFALEH